MISSALLGLTRLTRLIRTSGCWLLLAAGLAYALKHHYSRAGAGDLRWILGPTAALVQTATGTEYIFEQNVGYLSRDQRFVIAPSCAGVNFLIMTFAMSVWFLLPRFRSHPIRALSIPAALVGAYLLAIGANTLRIVVWLKLKHSTLVHGLDPNQVHRVAGIVIYFSCLMLCYMVLQRLFDRRQIDRRQIDRRQIDRRQIDRRLFVDREVAGGHEQRVGR